MHQTKIKKLLRTFLNKLVITLQNEDLDSENNIVIGGDFNCPLSPTIDKKFLFHENLSHLALLACEVNFI